MALERLARRRCLGRKGVELVGEGEGVRGNPGEGGLQRRRTAPNKNKMGPFKRTQLHNSGFWGRQSEALGSWRLERPGPPGVLVGGAWDGL